MAIRRKGALRTSSVLAVFAVAVLQVARTNVLHLPLAWLLPGSRVSRAPVLETSLEARHRRRPFAGKTAVATHRAFPAKQITSVSAFNVYFTKQVTGVLLIPLVALLYSSPIPVLRKIVQAKSTLKYVFLPYLLLFANCTAWVVYCLHRGWASMYEPLIINIYGLGVNTVALWIFNHYITDETIRSKFNQQASLTAIGILCLAVVSFTTSFKRWWGYVTLAVNCLLFIGPLAAFDDVWRTKSVEYMPMNTILPGLVASANASIYFYCLRDAVGLIPNAVGVFLSAVQIMFYGFVRTKFGQGKCQS